MAINKYDLTIILCGFILIQACTQKTTVNSTHFPSAISWVDPKAFEEMAQGKQTRLYMLKNKKTYAAITNYGARLVSLVVPSKNGNLTDVVLGYDSVKSYWKTGEPAFGATIARYANRLGKGMFSIDNKAYQVDTYTGANILHGGKTGFHRKVWEAKQINDHTLELNYFSPDGDGGFPGNLAIKVIYTLTNKNALAISYSATTDKNTIVNFTNHSYFNLNGEGSETINNHILSINADSYTAIDSTLLPTGVIQPVAGTPLDFTRPTEIGLRINDEQLRRTKGYDHNYVLTKQKGMGLAATVSSPLTGIVMKVFTEEPGMQLYTANNLNAKEKDGKGKKLYGARSALCLETQHYPDSPNHPGFPTTLLKAGETFKTSTIYQFSVERLLGTN